MTTLNTYLTNGGGAQDKLPFVEGMKADTQQQSCQFLKMKTEDYINSGVQYKKNVTLTTCRLVNPHACGYTALACHYTAANK